MKVIINNSSMQPIYEQIAGQIKEQIMNGTLKRDELLPSVRNLSRDLRVSALTVKKAYDALEQEGFVITVHGKESFVACAGNQIIMEERIKEVENALSEAVRMGRSYGMSREDIRDIFSSGFYCVEILSRKEGLMPVAEFFTAMAVIFLVVSIFNGIMLPIYIKNGVEKGRIIIMIVFGGMGLLGYAISYLTKNTGKYCCLLFMLGDFLNALLEEFVGTPVFYISIVILTAAVYFISMEVSYLLIKGEEY